MKRWLALSVLLLLGLTLALHADAAVRDVDATAALSDAGSGQYRLTIANLGSTTIGSVVFTPGPALKISSVVSTMTSNSMGTCALNASGISCNVALAPPPCTCMPGEQLELTFAASGDPGGSKAVVDNAKTFTFGTAPVTPPVTPPTTPPTTPPSTTPKALQKLSATVGARISFPAHAKAGRTRITVRDLSASDNFHLVGPGVNKKTGVGFKGAVTWTVTLKHGKYTFRSDAHAKLRGSTTVA